MQKTYWWRNILFLSSLTLVFVLFLYDTYFCYAYSKNTYCFSPGLEKALLEPLFFLSLSLLVVSPFLFFVRDEVFKKWLKFSAAWFVFAILLISVTPASIHSFSPLAGPDRETVSIWMSSLFVIISLVKISWDSWRMKKS